MNTSEVLLQLPKGDLVGGGPEGGGGQLQDKSIFSIFIMLC